MAQSKGNEENFSNEVNHLNELVDIFIKWSEMTYSTRYLIQSPKTKTQFKYEGILYYRSKAKPMRFDSRCVSVCGHAPRRQQRGAAHIRRQSFVLKAGGFFYPLVMPRVGRHQHALRIKSDWLCFCFA